MIGNWVRQTTTSTGTGNLTLSSVTGFPTFNDHPNFASGNLFFYSILDDTDGTPIESGIGYLSTSTTLVRDKILSTYAGGTYDDIAPAAVSLAAGTKRVICSEEGAASLPIHAVQNAFGSKIVLPDGIPPANNAKTVYADTALLICGHLNTSAEISQLTCHVSTAAGTGTDKIQLGIYSVNKSGLPGTLICRTGDIAPNSTGLKSVAPTTGNIRLPAGWYWFAIASNVSPGVVAGDAGGQRAAVSATPMGHAALNTRYGFFNATLTGGWSALPSTITLTGANSITADFPPTLGVILA